MHHRAASVKGRRRIEQPHTGRVEGIDGDVAEDGRADVPDRVSRAGGHVDEAVGPDRSREPVDRDLGLACEEVDQPLRPGAPAGGVLGRARSKLDTLFDSSSSLLGSAPGPSARATRGTGSSSAGPNFSVCSLWPRQFGATTHHMQQSVSFVPKGSWNAPVGMRQKSSSPITNDVLHRHLEVALDDEVHLRRTRMRMRDRRERIVCKPVSSGRPVERLPPRSLREEVRLGDPRVGVHRPRPDATPREKAPARCLARHRLTTLIRKKRRRSSWN